MFLPSFFTLPCPHNELNINWEEKKSSSEKENEKLIIGQNHDNYKKKQNINAQFFLIIKSFSKII